MKTRSPSQQRDASPPAQAVRSAALSIPPSASFIDNRPEAAVQRRAQQWAAESPQAARMQALQRKIDGAVSSGTQNAAPIQFVTWGTPTTRKVTVTGKNLSNTFEECTYNSIDYKAGDAKLTDGTLTGTADWADWLLNGGNRNNATQLHVVNRRWGGKGEADGKNLVPGSPGLNSHHLHEAEKKFDDVCFGGTGGATAQQNAKYECTVVPTYGTAVDVKNGDVTHTDPKMTVTVTTGTGAVPYDVTPGPGLIFTDPS